MAREGKLDKEVKVFGFEFMRRSRSGLVYMVPKVSIENCVYFAVGGWEVWVVIYKPAVWVVVIGAYTGYDLVMRVGKDVDDDDIEKVTDAWGKILNVFENEYWEDFYREFVEEVDEGFGDKGLAVFDLLKKALEVCLIGGC